MFAAETAVFEESSRCLDDDRPGWHGAALTQWCRTPGKFLPQSEADITTGSGLGGSMRTLAHLALLWRANHDNKAILADKNFAHQTRIQALKTALLGATLIMLAAGSSMSTLIPRPVFVIGPPERTNKADFAALPKPEPVTP